MESAENAQATLKQLMTDLHAFATLDISGTPKRESATR